MTTEEFTRIAASVSDDDRWQRWTSDCVPHDWRALPQTETGERYCPRCMMLFSVAGTVLNPPRVEAYPA